VLEIEPKWESDGAMPCDPRRPDLAVVMPLDPHTPRSARHVVAQVDHPSPDLRDVVMLLCSEVVTQAVERAPGGSVEVRVWMPEDVVRVELVGALDGLDKAIREHADHAEYAEVLLDGLADRWQIEAGEERPDASRIWFEIDRHPAERPVQAAY
jgi:hypothetical protein